MPVVKDHTCAECGHYEYRHGAYRHAPTLPEGDAERRMFTLDGFREPPQGSARALAYGYAAADLGVCRRYTSK